MCGVLLRLRAQREQSRTDGALRHAARRSRCRSARVVSRRQHRRLLRPDGRSATCDRHRYALSAHEGDDVMSKGLCAGQVALVTGASQGGTGTAIAIRLAAEGAKVAITARTVEGLEATRARIAEFGGECLVLPADLSDPHGDRTKLVERTEA